MMLGPHGAVTIYKNLSKPKCIEEAGGGGGGGGVLNHSHTANSDAEGAIKNVEAVSMSVQERRHPHFI